MSSIRMESTYVVLGEAAGIAAAHAVKSGSDVHEVDIDAIQADMIESGVITAWDGKVSVAEHQAFQDYKRAHPDGSRSLRNKTSLDN